MNMATEVLPSGRNHFGIKHRAVRGFGASSNTINNFEKIYEDSAMIIIIEMILVCTIAWLSREYEGIADIEINLLETDVLE